MGRPRLDERGSFSIALSSINASPKLRTTRWPISTTRGHLSHEPGRELPPTFFCHAQDDKTAPIDSTKAVEAQIRAQGAATRLDFYATGGHSTSHPGDASVEGHDWPDKFWPWVQVALL